MKVAIVTYEGRGSYDSDNIVDEDRLLAGILEEIGLVACFEVWSDPKVDWSGYSHILIKSPWDYFDRYAAFLAWCQKIKVLGIPVFNDIETVIWNSDKRYLLDVESRGFKIIPTRFISQNSWKGLEGFFDDFQADQLVLKPTVSGGAKNTFRLDRYSWSGQAQTIQGLLEQEDLMVQPFVKEVAEIGEHSYIYFNGKFSHAVLKSPQQGEFRVQHFFGGTIHPTQPSSDELFYLQKIVQEFASESLYARVDGVWVEGSFLIMELELIEPYLFLFTDRDAQSRYREAIATKLGLR